MHGPAAKASLLFGAMLTLSACAMFDSDEPEALAFEEPPVTTQEPLLIEGIPDVDLDEEETLLVAFEADWVCELQRRSFPTPDAMQDALNDKLVGLGVTRDEYDAFRAEVNNSQDLRDSILYAYQNKCRA